MGREPRRAYAKGQKGSKKGSLWILAARWIVGLAGTLYLSWLLLFPSLSGAVGAWTSERLFLSLGLGAYLLPLLLIKGLAGYLKSKKASGWTIAAAAGLLCLGASSSLLALLAQWLDLNPQNAGGILGLGLEARLALALGGFGALALSLASFLFSLQVLFGVRWSHWATKALQIVVQDFRDWKRSREALCSQLAQATAAPDSNAAPEEVRHGDPAGYAAPLASPPIIHVPKPPPHTPAPKARPSEGSPAAGSYEPPPFGLLNSPPPAKDRGKPLESEIGAAIGDLERTLRSFGVEAKVTGVAPGPVITRYELAPAPGVKVSSIVALENDIALALKARGIRIIAPIPGKAAVGVEIPNARPALVVLREILESQALPAQAPLLSFALGLSSSGEPKAADLQKMPHVLIAGATNSGKSVTIHSLILSILFRARPDEVKFLLIDPKRLELTFYDGIPHLFDPTSPADKVGVVTNPKDASKSLLALVKLMERRYERFQLFGVRNIDSYNKEADKRGQPREFFIVVVIDELADLMLVAQDSVEDSIQRLTQMARAVGIHLVLATQRPSVDVITGVIKANLPCRIALQVISKVDSKVILDCMGAESLQGKGDLLYLAAGAQKPERCQGAYVSEEEISKIAGHLRAQGKPDYPTLETMAKAAEADLSSFGVEPLEFSQALKLVLERRRVSQDLLKSQFGSSARATNLLSLLEVKEMIHKPEGSNRWEIHFDLIEDYLHKHFPQVPIDRKDV
ncbi:MAG: DNA translocase FtsK [Elusimicrobia bacterium]|nr:DNA translocase FtsK [Elusimicrobiota bacterium]